MLNSSQQFDKEFDEFGKLLEKYEKELNTLDKQAKKDADEAQVKELQGKFRVSEIYFACLVCFTLRSSILGAVSLRLGGKLAPELVYVVLRKELLNFSLEAAP